MMKKISRIMRDMLKEYNEEEGKVKFSQGRVYLFIAIIAYYSTLGILTFAGVGKKHAELDMNNFGIIVDALKYSMGLFAGYVLGGKALNAINVLAGRGKLPEDPNKKMLND